MNRQPGQVPAKLLWPIVRAGNSRTSVHEERGEFIDVRQCPPGNPNFPYSLRQRWSPAALNITGPDLSGYPFWDSFSRCTDAFFVDKYMGKTEFWKLVCAKIDFIEQNYREKPGNIKIFVDNNDVATTQQKINAELTTLGINDVFITVKAIPGYIHDRFALFDDELWHCGASAAAVHHKLHAISGPWPDTDARFKNFLLGII